jgi:hypothetical protein
MHALVVDLFDDLIAGWKVALLGEESCRKNERSGE